VGCCCCGLPWCLVYILEFAVEKGAGALLQPPESMPARPAAGPARPLEGVMVTTMLPGFEASTLVVPMVLGPGGPGDGPDSVLGASCCSSCF